MFKQIDDYLRCFRITSDAPIPFAVNAHIPLLFQCSSDYFTFVYDATSVITRFSCIENYLIDQGKQDLFLSFRQYISQIQIPDSHVQYFTRLQLIRENQPYLPRLGSIILNLQKDLITFKQILKSSLGSFQVRGVFLRPDILFDDDTPSELNDFYPIRGIEWTVKSSYNVHAGSNQYFTTLTIKDWK
ncbi:hypothetical protein SS50377_25469 [Spironucleus salmonicida]|uniref:Uncharacterized protein n=1 Tax=Spironucleus salmonicida TaxID=348837 RepID=V6LKC7_9EUKA|nr:hypothetical protein SS50377_25469 [Spironucleus salmonicida]|eukprot:EST45017.1 Hypothetical protein SS50377_15036 [Spironucleus salmonicida]